MLEATYIHCPGVGPQTERRLWEAGAFTWRDYLSLESELAVIRRARPILTPLVCESVDRLARSDFAWFGRALPQREHWRAYPAFRDRTVFLDIETTGGPDGGVVTVVGVHDGETLRQFVRGVDLEKFPDTIADAAVIVTFFGTGFDLPVLRSAFGMQFPQLHVDLCYLLKRLGHSGGLKQVERQLGITRSHATGGLSGFDAVRLWWRWRRGDRDALDLLLAYNAEDVLNLKRLLEIAFPAILVRTSGGLNSRQMPSTLR